MSASIERRGRRHYIQIDLELDEAENIAYALGLRDAGAQELLALVDEARRRSDDEGDRP